MPSPRMTISVALLALACTDAGRAQVVDWPQWRGPARNGVAGSDGVELRRSWPESGLPKLWDSEPIPSDDYGGHGSPVAVGGRIYLALAWHRDEPTSTRCIEELVLRKLGYQRLALPPELIEKMEQVRLSIGRRMRGKKLEEWTQQWLTKNFDEAQRERYSGYVRRRFRQGRQAIAVADLDRIVEVRDRVFEDESKFVEWLDAQGFAQATRQRVLDAVPATRRVADDVVICLDADTGKTKWKTALPGAVTGRRSSSTPCVADGKLYAVGSTRIFCVDAVTGAKIWETAVSKGAASSPLIRDGIVTALVGRLTAFDGETGERLWQSREVRGRNGSPTIWERPGGAVLVCNSQRDLCGVELTTGKLLWRVKGGGDSTPAIRGDLVAVHAKSVGLALYSFDPKRPDAAPELVWSRPLKSRRQSSSPLLHGGHVYLFGGGQQLCLSVADGAARWAERRNSEITSPVLCGDRILALHTNGRFLSMVRATGDGFEEMARVRIGAMRCPSPAVLGGRLVVRMNEHLTCFDLR